MYIYDGYIWLYCTILYCTLISVCKFANISVFQYLSMWVCKCVIVFLHVLLDFDPLRIKHFFGIFELILLIVIIFPLLLELSHLSPKLGIIPWTIFHIYNIRYLSWRLCTEYNFMISKGLFTNYVIGIGGGSAEILHMITGGRGGVGQNITGLWAGLVTNMMNFYPLLY